MKCTVCGKRFKPKKEDRYESYYVNVPLLGNPTTIIKDCFDCPRCGCQIIAGARLEKVEESEVACDVCQKKDD